MAGNVLGTHEPAQRVERRGARPGAVGARVRGRCEGEVSPLSIP